MVTIERGRVRLDYQWTPHGADPVPITCSLWLDRTPCHFGGSRDWFLCPNCGRRCAVVYFGARGGRYACRKCLNLAYMTEAEDGIGRLWRRQWKLEARLGADGNKPKGMHWKTAERIWARIAEVEETKDALFCYQAARLLGITS